MALGITLSEWAWIFKRELAIMILLCLFSSCFYFSQGRGKKQRIDVGALVSDPSSRCLGKEPKTKSHANRILLI